MTRREAARGWRLPRPPVTGNGGHYWSMQPAEPVGSSAAADPAPTRVRAPSPCVRARARVCAVRPPSTARAPPSWRRRPQVPARTRRGRRWQRACRPCRRRRAQERPCSRLSRRCDRAEDALGAGRALGKRGSKGRSICTNAVRAAERHLAGRPRRLAACLRPPTSAARRPYSADQ